MRILLIEQKHLNYLEDHTEEMKQWKIIEIYLKKNV